LKVLNTLLVYGDLVIVPDRVFRKEIEDDKLWRFRSDVNSNFTSFLPFLSQLEGPTHNEIHRRRPHSQPSDFVSLIRPMIRTKAFNLHLRRTSTMHEGDECGC
jgi:hypothetical protein